MAETGQKSAVTTTDHDEIRRWVESQGGRPCTVSGTGNGQPGILRIDFGEPDEGLEEISWEQFFEKFEQEELALLHSTEDASRFNKFVQR